MRNALDDKEKAALHVLWHYGDPRGEEPGGFVRKLLEAWASADRENYLRLYEAFPAYGEALNHVDRHGVGSLANRWKR